MQISAPKAAAARGVPEAEPDSTRGAMPMRGRAETVPYARIAHRNSARPQTNGAPAQSRQKNEPFSEVRLYSGRQENKNRRNQSTQRTFDFYERINFLRKRERAIPATGKPFHKGGLLSAASSGTAAFRPARLALPPPKVNVSGDSPRTPLSWAAGRRVYFRFRA